MWRVSLVAACVLGCGRIGFTERTTGDAAVADGGFRHVVAYADTTCAVLEGRAYCWGLNDRGQIGDGTTSNREVPRRVALPDGGPITALAQGDDHACAIVDGDVYCWGSSFAPAPGLVGLGGEVASDIAAGRNFTCALVLGTVRCWGFNDAGQLGDGTMAPRTQPTPVSSAAVFTAIDSGDDHSCGLTTSGAMCWGHNDEGTLGLGSLTPSTALVPMPVAGGITAVPRIAGWHACSLDGGVVQCWGRNAEGALGDGTQTATATPQPVPGLAGVSAIATGGGPTDFDSTCAIREGAVSCWGAGSFGRLGTGDDNDALVPAAVVGLPGEALEVAIGYAHACALLADGDIWCWGRGDQGQLGDGNATSSLAPVRVTPPEPS